MAKKKILKELRSLSLRLPMQFSEGKMYIKGSEIRARVTAMQVSQNKKIEAPKDTDGLEIDPDKMYVLPQNIQVNHYRRAKRIYERYGWDGLKQYADEVVELYLKAADAHKQILASLPSSSIMPGL